MFNKKNAEAVAVTAVGVIVAQLVVAGAQGIYGAIKNRKKAEKPAVQQAEKKVGNA